MRLLNKKNMEKQKSIGALWVKTYEKDGNKHKYITIALEVAGKKFELVGFPNPKKDAQSPNQPNFWIYLSKRSQQNDFNDNLEDDLI